jgi:hypothetical protein
MMLSAPTPTPKSMAGTNWSAMSTLSSVVRESLGLGWIRPYMVLPTAPLATTVWLSPVHSFRSEPQQKGEG